MKIIEKLNSDYKNGAATIAFLGDSVTHGCFESKTSMHSSFDFQAVYHNQLKNILHLLFPTMPINLINAGIGGDCAKNAIQRLERDVLSKSPDLTVVCFGLNDVHGTLENYISSLDKIFQSLSDAGSELIFMTPNMLNTYVSEDICENELREIAQKTAQFQTQGRMDNYILSAIECARKHKVPVANCYSKWKTMYKNGVDTTQLLANYINHPVRKLHKLFAFELVQTMFENECHSSSHIFRNV